MPVLYLNRHRTTTGQLSPAQLKHPHFHVIFACTSNQESFTCFQHLTAVLFFFSPKLPSYCHLAVLPHGPDLWVLHAECCLSRKSCKNQKNPIWSASAVIGYWAPSHTRPPPRKFMVRYPSSSRGVGTCCCAFSQGAVCTFRREWWPWMRQWAAHVCAAVWFSPFFFESCRKQRAIPAKPSSSLADGVCHQVRRDGRQWSVWAPRGA